MSFGGFRFWGYWTGLQFLTPPSAWEYILVVVCVAVGVVTLVYTRRDWALRRLPLFVLLCLAPLLTCRLLVIDFSLPGLLPPPNIPVLPAQPFVALLEMLPVALAGALLGAGPAMVVGFIEGVLHAGMMRGGIAAPFYFALCGLLLGFFLRQDYRGYLPQAMRHPLLASPAAILLASPLLLLSVFAHAVNAGLAGIDYAVTLTAAHIVPLLVEGLLTGLAVMLLYLLFPRLRPVRAAYRFPPYAYTLNRRLLFLFLPLISLMTCVLVYAVTARTLSVSSQELIYEMERDASGAANHIMYFFTLGQGLLRGFANDEMLWRQNDPAALEACLEANFRSQAFFKQLLLLDLEGRVVAMWPPESAGGDAQLTAEEMELAEQAAMYGETPPSTVHSSARGEAILSFLAPVPSEEVGERVGVLVGRTQLADHPVIAPILESLQRMGVDGSMQGEGFIVENVGDHWQIVAHTDPSLLRAVWQMDEAAPPIETLYEGGRAYESRNPRDNTRQLVYYLPVEGYPSWAVVCRLPYEVVLQQATLIATPLLLLQMVLGGGLLIVIPFVTSWLTRPLKMLAAAADRIAEGDLAQPVQVPGSDEVARVGDAFEGMRKRLKGRLEDLSLLLRTSQAVSATLDLTEGVPTILEGALSALQAQVARLIMLSSDGYPQMVMARGDPREGLGALDRALCEAARGLQGPLVVENLARARTLATPEVLASPVRSLVALPVRTKDRLSALMWVGYSEVRQFDASEVGLLSTLASQTAVLVENARLFQSAEGGRRQLAAVLASTTDAVLVTDRDDCIVLVNPAAERAFGVSANAVVGRRVLETELASSLSHIFSRPLGTGEALAEEVPLSDGRTLYASVSVILSTDGERIGRVAVMRDITRFKELDELKSEFVATVSHDLRAPLTFMRGYATMLPMVGELSSKQRDYVEKILHGIGQMSELIDDLLDLGRIEAGVGLERKPCHLGAILVEAVDGMRARAAAKGLTLRLEPAQGAAVVSGDAALLRQVVTNIVDNAIKYTPSGGVVTVGLAVRGQQAVIRVADTGIGIDRDDQVRLFEKFYRIKRRDTADIPGTGLGLAIVKSIVERHGGRVWVESELNKGSTFYVSLPLGEEPPRSES